MEKGGRLKQGNPPETTAVSTWWLRWDADVKVMCSVGDGVARELTRMTHGHEQWCGDCLREWGVMCGGW